ncbi:interferon-inducible GTPase 1-like [Mercenaria mercenaria]|uniref:interferon-inducible GTPase 1-like n=1 Tax=Mercenaria mercenaria TaxID=6596 RepID=UPI00234F7BE9|nr:interferon-inducible GTPase 1-like [Mercenaria mercenaria]
MAVQKKRGFFERLFEKFAGTKESESTPVSSKINVEEYKKELHDKGVAGVKELLNKDLENWTEIELHTAVVGNSGTGKSSFINSIRGLKAKDPGAAKVGVNETTVTCVPYKHPDNKSFIVWDIPGVGTPKFPKDSYLENVGYDKYDFFIIMSRSRFTENDLWLALEVQKLNKRFFFVRSNIDKDIEDDREDNPDTHDEENVLQAIRKKTEDELMGNGVRAPKVFLINNRKTDRYDFGKLNNEMLSSCDGLKKDSMALSLAAVTKEVMAEKKRVLERRISQIALAVTSSSGEYEQKGRFQDEIKFYQKQFDIDDVTLAENKDILTLSDSNMQEFKVVFDQYGSEGQLSMKTPTAMRAEASTWERFKDCFTWSKENTLLFGYCKLALRSNLDQLYDKARSLYDIKRAKQMVDAAAK